MKTDKTTSNVSWAKELGMDISFLKRESPDHPSQVFMKIRHCKEADAYWRWKGSTHGDVQGYKRA